MDAETLQVIQDTIQASIKETVNGKIDRLSEKIDTHNTKHEADMKEVREHISEVKPILEAYNGTKALGNLVKWVGGVVITAGAVWAIFFKQ